MDWGSVIVGAVIGGVLGFYIGRYSLMGRIVKLRTAIASLQAEVDVLKRRHWGPKGRPH